MRALLAGCLLLFAPAASAGMAFTPCLSGEPDEVVLAVEVLSSGDPLATRDSPPRVQLRVLQALSGRAPAGRLRVTWLPGDHDIDYVGGDSAARLHEWSAAAFPGPRVGERLLVRLGVPYRPAAGRVVLSQCVYRDTPTARAELRAELRSTRASAREGRAWEAQERREWRRAFARAETQRRKDARRELPRLGREATDVWLVRRLKSPEYEFHFEVVASLKGGGLKLLRTQQGPRPRVTLHSSFLHPHLWTLMSGTPAVGGEGVRELVLFVRPRSCEVPPDCTWFPVDPLLAAQPATRQRVREVRWQLAQSPG